MYIVGYVAVFLTWVYFLGVAFWCGEGCLLLFFVLLGVGSVVFCYLACEWFGDKFF